MIIYNVHEIKDKLCHFRRHDCVVIICKYNRGKSSIATDLIHEYFGEDYTFYVTFIDQSKPNFIPRKSKLKFGEITKDKVIVFDELSEENGRDINGYVKRLIDKNLVIILSNPYGSGNGDEKEIKLFKEHEKNILPEDTLFIFVKE